MSVAKNPEVLTRESKESSSAFEFRVEQRRREREENGEKATAHKLGGAKGLGVKGASRYIIAVW